MPHTLVIGGTGPSGRPIIMGLLERDHRVTVLHTGQHEAELPDEVEHIHTDPHFHEPLSESLIGKRFDVVVATYGRVRVIADVVRDCTDRLITISGSAYANATDPGWGPLGTPMLVREAGSAMQEVQDDRAMPHRVWKTEQHLLGLHAAGAFSLTTIRYPLLYGPGTPANPDWGLVRRALDKRPTLLLGDGGCRVRNRGYSANVAQATLLAVDRPAVSDGKIYNVADVYQYQQRTIAQYIAGLLGHEFEIVDIPGEISTRLYRDSGLDTIGYYAFDTSEIQRDLGYVDTVPVPEALTRSVEWLAAHPLEPGGEVERQLGDPFDYELEDKLAAIYRGAFTQAAASVPPVGERPHMYRHPSKPFEAWSPPETANA